jgi:hypothetical protein
MTDEERIAKLKKELEPAIRLFDALRELGVQLEAGGDLGEAEEAFQKRMKFLPTDILEVLEDTKRGFGEGSRSAEVVHGWIGGDDSHMDFSEAMEHLGGRPSRALLRTIPDLPTALEGATVDAEGAVSISLGATEGWYFGPEEG